MNKKQKKLLIRILLSGFLLGLYTMLGEALPERFGLLFYLLPYFIAGYDILRKAYKGILKKQVFNENFLMAIATIGAMILREYSEGVAVMWFYQVGELFQSYAVNKSRKNIAELMDIRPDYANIETETGLLRVDPYEVEVGSLIVVKPGEKVPLDGMVMEGASSLNMISLTGESLPREVMEGDMVISGSINISGLLKIRTTKDFQESTVTKILELVENAGDKKARSEKFITKFARVYTPFVVISALVLAFLPPLFLSVFLKEAVDFSDWIYRAMTFLVISCPCAIVVSVPLSFFGGIGGAGSKGILIKGANYMEALSNIKTLIFDKTGTLTKGSFEVSGVHHSTIEDEKLIEYAALAECFSDHPISQSLKRVYPKPIDMDRVKLIKEISGEGVLSLVDGIEIAAGNMKLMKRFGIEATECRSVGTIVHIAIERKYSGHIVISDEIKKESEGLIRELKKLHVKRAVMLTGDGRKAAEAVAKRLGISEFYPELLPEDKVRLMEGFLKEKKVGESLAFAGDGINDAPVLRGADVGIAMGALGSDAAIEAADVVLMDDNPMKIALAIRIARKCIRIVKQNIVFAIGVKLAVLVLGALGIANMWLAIFADVGVMVLCVLNAIRCLRIKEG